MERESMEFDVLIVGAGPAGLSAACRIMQRRRKPAKRSASASLRKGPKSAHTSWPARCSSRGPERALPQLERAGRPLNTPVTRDDIFCSDCRSPQGAQRLRSQEHAQPRQLHHQPGQPVPLAGRTGRKPGRGSLPRLCRRGSMIIEHGQVKVCSPVIWAYP